MTNRRRDDSVTRKITSFRFDVELLKRFSEFAKANGYNCTEGLEVLMVKAMEGLLPKKGITWVGNESPYGHSVLRINAKPYPTRAEVIDKLENMGDYKLANHYRKEKKSDVAAAATYCYENSSESMQPYVDSMRDNMLANKIELATTVLKNYLTKENLLENVIEGPMVQEMFGKKYIVAKFSHGGMTGVSIDDGQLVYRFDESEKNQ